MQIRKYGRYWAVYDADGTLVYVCLYKKGALEVVLASVRETLTTKSADA